MRFKLLEGKHGEGKGAERRDYKKGDVVESEHKLDEMFINKFQRLGDKEPAEVKEARTEQEKSEKKKAKKGTEGALATIDANNAKVGLPPMLPGTASVMKETNESGTEVTSDLGENVTEDFPLASEAGFAVFKDEDKKFHITEVDDTDTAVKKGSGLDKAGVNKFLKKQIKG